MTLLRERPDLRIFCWTDANRLDDRERCQDTAYIIAGEDMEVRPYAVSKPWPLPDGNEPVEGSRLGVNFHLGLGQSVNSVFSIFQP